MSENGIDSPDYQEFISYLQQNKKRIFGFIFAAVPDYATAEDIMQDTIIRLWLKYSTFEPGTNFAAWGVSYAKYVIMEYRKKNRGSCVQFDNQSLDNLSILFESDRHVDYRVEALRDCLSKLPEASRQVIRMRYSDNLTIKSIAIRLGRSIPGMYKAMMKIQSLLQECVEGRLGRWNVE